MTENTPSLRGTTLGVTRFIQPNTLVFAGQSPTTLHKTQGKQDTFCTVVGDCHGLRPRNDGGLLELDIYVL